ALFRSLGSATEFRTDQLLRGRPGPDVNALVSVQTSVAQPASCTSCPPSSGPGTSRGQRPAGAHRRRWRSILPARSPALPTAGARPPPAGGPGSPPKRWPAGGSRLLVTFLRREPT